MATRVKHKNRLIVRFAEKAKDQLYKGESWYKKNLIDQLDIKRNCIEIDFERTNEINENYLFTSSCPVRIELYKAVCFYLAVTGRMPKVKEVKLYQDSKEMEISAKRLIRHWEDCNVQITIPATVAEKCFKSDGAKSYIAITYFLKAQLDAFSHDCFRAAWSGLNALYEDMSKDWHERSKLNGLSAFLKVNEPKRAELYVKQFDNSVLWDRLEWYNYVMWKKPSTLEKELFTDDAYPDCIIYEKLCVQLIAQYMKNDNKVTADECNKKYIKRRGKKQKRIIDQVLFLVKNYCYMLRNRSFHADRPYPVFGLFDEDVESTESILTKVLLYTICDILEYKAED